jgi:hypothetical protein
MANIGKCSGMTRITIGANAQDLSQKLTGTVGEVIFVRFTSLPSDISTTIANISAHKNKPFPSSYTNGTIVGWWFKGSSGHDYSGTGNDLSPTASPPIQKVRY